MTSEEAIKMIQDDKRLHHDYLSGEYRKALNMAIEALKQQKTAKQIPIIDKWGDDVVVALGGYKCSICGNFDCMKTKYCCECGAKMEAE